MAEDRATAPCASKHSHRIAWRGIARGLALFAGGFGLLNVLGELRHAGFDANLWWIDLRPAPAWATQAFLTVTSLVLLAYAVRPARGRWRRAVTVGVTLALLVLALSNAVGFFALAARGDIVAGCPVPFSLLVGGALAIVLATVVRPSAGNARCGAWTERLAIGLTVAACVIGFPLAQMICFGLTDYRRPADVAVVFGARVYADGNPSLAVADRVRTGCALYRERLVGVVILSGGPGDGATHETEAMRQLATELGVPAEDLVIDAQGVNTDATCRNTSAMFASLGTARVLAVSHFYHLPRIKLCYQRYGCEVCTVPARQTRPLARLPRFMVRETAALWLYYLRPLWPGRAAGRP